LVCLDHITGPPDQHAAGNLQAVKTLLQLGASTRDKDEQRRSALDIAKLMHSSGASDTDASTWKELIAVLSKHAEHDNSATVSSPQRAVAPGTPSAGAQTPKTPYSSRGRPVNARTPQDDAQAAEAVDIASARPVLNEHSNLQESYELPNVGDTVAVRGMTGIVRFRGLTKFEPGEWVGIQLADPIGRNNGSVGGIQYFKCPPRCAGLLNHVPLTSAVDVASLCPPTL
jgi:hypothetical protein